MIECAQYIFDTFRSIDTIFIPNTWKTLIKYHIRQSRGPWAWRPLHSAELTTLNFGPSSLELYNSAQDKLDRRNTVKIFKTHMLQMWVLIKSQAIYYSLDPKSTRWHPPCLPGPCLHLGYPPTPFETLLKPLLHSRLTFSWMYKLWLRHRFGTFR